MAIILWIHPKDRAEILLEWGGFFAKEFDLSLIVCFSGPRQAATESKSLYSKERLEGSFLALIPSQIVLNQLNGPSQFELLQNACKDNNARLLICGPRGMEELDGLCEKKNSRYWSDHLPCPSIVMRGKNPADSLSLRVGVNLHGHSADADLLRFSRNWGKLNPNLAVDYFQNFDHRNEESEQEAIRYLNELNQKIGIKDRTNKEADIAIKILENQAFCDEIRELSANGYRLIIAAPPNQQWMHRLLYDTLKEEEAYDENIAAIGIFFKSGEPHQAIAGSLIEKLQSLLPALNRQDRLHLFEQLEHRSNSNIDFVTLIILASLIASLGLLQNSPAIIIGAMLVAPLMTPMIGAGLGLVQGNVLLVKNAVITIGNGFLMALLLGVLVGVLVPGTHLSSEILSRTSPNVLDLMVALLSGIAAAYSTARPGLMGALPGVAIAAALVPPLASAGICISRSQPLLGIGAASLFGINLIAIILASAITLYFLGLRPVELLRPYRLWAQRSLQILLIAALVISFPLTIAFIEQLNPPVTNRLKQLKAHWPGPSELILLEQNRPNSKVIILHVNSPKPLENEELEGIRVIVEQFYGENIELEVHQTLVTKI